MKKLTHLTAIALIVAGAVACDRHESQPEPAPVAVDTAVTASETSTTTTDVTTSDATATDATTSDATTAPATDSTATK